MSENVWRWKCIMWASSGALCYATTANVYGIVVQCWRMFHRMDCVLQQPTTFRNMLANKRRQTGLKCTARHPINSRVMLNFYQTVGLWSSDMFHPFDLLWWIVFSRKAERRPRAVRFPHSFHSTMSGKFFRSSHLSTGTSRLGDLVPVLTITSFAPTGRKRRIDSIWIHGGRRMERRWKKNAFAPFRRTMLLMSTSRHNGSQRNSNPFARSS